MAYGYWGQPEPPRRRGLLSRAQYGAQPLEPYAQGPQAPQLSFTPEVTQQVQASPWTRIKEGMDGIQPQTWLQIAGGLLDRAEGEGTWGEALGGVGTALQGQQDRALRQEDVDYTRGQRQQEAQQRQAREAWISSLPPDQQALARVAPDQIVAAQAPLSRAQQAELDTARERARVQDSQWQAGYNLDRQQLGLAQQRLQQDRFLNSQLATLGRDEAGYVTGLRGKLDTGREVMRNVNELQAILNRSPDIFGALLEGDQEAALRKFGRGDPQKIADIQRVYAINTEIAREELRGQTPISNLDFLSQMRAGPGTQNMGQAVQAWINRANSEYGDAQQRFNSAYEYLQRNGSLYTPDPTTGKNWYQGAYGNVVQQPSSGGQAGPASAPAPASAAPQARVFNAQALPPPARLANGTRATDERTGRTFVVRNGQWMPETQRGATRNSSLTGGRRTD